MATRLAVSQGLESPASVNTGLPKQRGTVNEEGVRIIDEKGTTRWLTPDQFGAQDDQTLWMSNKLSTTNCTPRSSNYNALCCRYW